MTRISRLGRPKLKHNPIITNACTLASLDSLHNSQEFKMQRFCVDSSFLFFSLSFFCCELFLRFYFNCGLSHRLRLMFLIRFLHLVILSGIRLVAIPHISQNLSD